MSIITDDMVEKAVRTCLGDFDPDYYQEFRTALEAVANDIIEACALQLEKNGTSILSVYNRGPDDPPGNAIVPFNGKIAADQIRSLKST